ncbi:TRAP transporter small permease [Bacillus sp. HNG]|uniref:TRAP transporter small permease n=1 Tax=Bacillus sp. HNG TaxID=2293325 RepID=UPI001671F42D|nr:TRAP transporter small permease [Bacillus sp. HNG]
MSKFNDRLFKGIDYLLGIMLALIVFFVFLNVVLRTVFNSGLTWSEEIARYLFVYITYIGAIGAMRSNVHLGMDSVMHKLPQGLKRVTYIIAQIIIIIIMIMLTHGAYTMTLQSVEARAAATGIPLSIIYGVGMLTGICIALICVTNIVKVMKEPESINKLITLHESDEDDVLDNMKNDDEDNEKR